MHVTLIFPPHTLPLTPPVSLPLLTGFLREKGIKVKPLDLNCEALDHLLCPEVIQENYGILLKKNLKGRGVYHRDDIIKYKQVLVSSIEQAKNTMRSKRHFYSQSKLNWSVFLIQKAFELFSLSSYPHKFTFAGSDLVIDRQGTLLSASKVPTIFDDFLKKRAVDIARSKTRLLGFSVNSFTQLLYALKLARQIRQTCPNMHLTVGGTFLCAFKNYFKDFSPIFDLFDTVIIHEGEHALLDLVDYLRAGKPFNKCRNLIFKNNGRIQKSPLLFQEDPNSLPLPDFDGLPLGKYFVPETVVSLPLARGCYFGACTYCGYNHNFIGRYREENVSRIVEKIRSLQKQLKTRYFIFSVSALAPVLAKELSRQLVRNKIKIHWMSQARAEAAFDEDAFSALAKAGCRMLAFGFESANPRILGLMNKGIMPRDQKRVLKACKKNGIQVEVDILYNFLDEKPLELKDTLDFLYEHKSSITYLALNDFFVAMDSPIFWDPERFGLVVSAPTASRGIIKLFNGRVKWRTYARKNSGEEKKQKALILKDFLANMSEEGFRKASKKYLVNGRLTAQTNSVFNLLYSSRGSQTNEAHRPACRNP
ncbi:MAG: radical SAM protein [Candidatus Margulisiibacteriota bacterium]